MAPRSTKRCRSCNSETLSRNFHSINDVGYKSLTFKQLFEQSLGYTIQEWEPQIFCKSCTSLLIDWHKFRDQCDEVQNQQMVLLTPIKKEIPEEVFEIPLISIKKEPIEDEIDEFLPLLNVKTELIEENIPPPAKRIKITPEVLKNERPKTTFTFDAFIRSYVNEPLSKAESLGKFKTKVTNADYGPMLTCFKQILWSAIKGHIVREVRFDDNGRPYMHEGYPGYATVRDIRKFVDLKVNNQPLSLRDAKHQLKNWKTKTLTLYIYPLSNHIITKNDCEKAKKLIADTLPLETLIADCPFLDCPVVAIASQLESHRKICSFNPDHNGIIFCCLSIGCTVSVASKAALDHHYETCPYKLLMDHRRIQQWEKNGEDDKLLLKQKMVEATTKTEVVFANCPFSECHNPKPSKKTKKK